jgi:DNA invertase Pin-like site-specific DNA recombinase
VGARAGRGGRGGRLELDRPGLSAAVEAVASGAVDGPVVSKLDRLSRSVADFSALLERFRSKAWGLVILDLGIDTTTMMGEAMAMAATSAQVERRRIGERTREALSVRKAQEVELGRRSGVAPPHRPADPPPASKRQDARRHRGEAERRRCSDGAGRTRVVPRDGSVRARAGGGVTDGGAERQESTRRTCERARIAPAGTSA